MTQATALDILAISRGETGMSFVIVQPCGCYVAAFVIADDTRDRIEECKALSKCKWDEVSHESVRTNPWGCFQCRPDVYRRDGKRRARTLARVARRVVAN